MSNLIKLTIDNEVKEIHEIVYKGERVLTSNQLSELFGCSYDSIRINFKNNFSRFIEGKHYILLESNELKEFKNNANNISVVGNGSRINKLYLWTERGTLRHSKLIGTDKAWDIQEILEDCYFKVKTNNLPTNYIQALERLLESEKEKQRLMEDNENKTKLLREQKPKVEGYNTFLDTKNCLTMSELAKTLSDQGFKIGRNRLFQLLRDKKILMVNNEPYQLYIDNGYFLVRQVVINHSDYNETKSQTLITKKGAEYIKKLLSKII